MRLPRDIGLTARTRIIGWMLLVVTVALSAELIISTRVLTERAESDLSRELAHEGDKFRDYAERTADPSTGQPYGDVSKLLADYLAQAVPNGDETMFSLVGGEPARRVRAEPLARLDHNQRFLTRVSGVTEPESGSVSTAAGPARYAVFPVQVEGDPDRGALVVVEFAEPRQEEVAAIVRVLAVISLAALALAGLVSWQVAGRVLAPIRTLRKAAETIGESALDLRIEVTGKDDVAALARTFNQMLDRIETAFASQREFLDDASHELRTPITVIRGHLELISDDPAKRAQTLALVLDELERMNRLVDDLVLLAKADRPDFLSLALVDVTDLVMTVLAKASALADRRWALGGVTDRIVLADDQRLTQALMQLTANAVRHTRPGDRITIGSRVVGDRLQLIVTDTGTGIAAEDADRIFERFTRGGQRGDRGTRGEGAGLGLAIVTSVARAHGGEVLLDSTPGKGSTFVLDLPLKPVEATGQARPDTDRRLSEVHP
jgi:signal transduction histidine kinase